MNFDSPQNGKQSRRRKTLSKVPFLDFRAIARTPHFHATTRQAEFLALLVEGQTDEFRVYRDGYLLCHEGGQPMILPFNLLFTAGWYLSTQDDGSRAYWEDCPPTF